MVRKNWAHTHDFKDLNELMAECGGREVRVHLLTATKNATYILPQ